MSRSGRTPRVGTTNRPVDAETVRCSAVTLHTNIRAAQQDYHIPPEFTLNPDKKIVLLGQNCMWTWARRGAKVVPLRKLRLGFTAMVTTCADGSVPEVLMLWVGTTERWFARTSDDLHPAISQDFSGCKDTHFQNAVTWERFLRRLMVHLAQKRQRLNLPEAHAMVYYNAAPQHTMSDALCAK